MAKILIVEDEAEIQKIFQVFFGTLGYTDIKCASDGLEAYSLCSQNEFDLKTLDHQMPFMTGAEFLTALRLKNNPNQETPVLMISSFIPDVEESLKTFESTFFLDKPVQLDKLATYLKLLVQKKPLEKAGQKEVPLLQLMAEQAAKLQNCAGPSLKKNKLHDLVEPAKNNSYKIKLGGAIMGSEIDTVSGWFVLNAGFKVYGRCPDCHSPRISFYTNRSPGMKGMSYTSKGLIPVCTDCGKSLPTKVTKEQKLLQGRRPKKKVIVQQ